MSSKLKVWLLLTIIFIVGAFTGAALTIGLAPRFLHPPGEMPTRHHLMAYFVKRLNLTTDQQAKIQPIVTDAETRIQALHHEEVERGSQIFKEASDKIATILNPDQKVELQKMESEREKMFSGHAHHHNGPEDGQMPPPPPPPNAPPPSTPDAATNDMSAPVPRKS
jgi:Spy/CpxP family protein refolding chaperone